MRRITYYCCEHERIWQPPNRTGQPNQYDGHWRVLSLQRLKMALRWAHAAECQGEIDVKCIPCDKCQPGPGPGKRGQEKEREYTMQPDVVIDKGWTTANELEFLAGLGTFSSLEGGRRDRLMLLKKYQKVSRYDWGAVNERKVMREVERMILKSAGEAKG